MKIKNSKEITERIMMLASYSNIGGDLNAIIMDNIHNKSFIPKPSELPDLKSAAEKIIAEIPEENRSGASVEKTELLLIAEQLLQPYFDQEILSYIMGYLLDSCVEFDAAEFSENPFIKLIHIEDKTYGRLKTGYDVLKPFELDVCTTPKNAAVSDFGTPCLCCYTEDIRYPAIYDSKTNEMVMSVSPSEIMHMAEFTESASGKVLCLGAGNGYFTFMAARKEETESVTVVENDSDVISLLEDIISCSDYADKVTIIKEKPEKYLESLKDGQYDYCFSDMFEDTKNLELYLKTKDIFRSFSKTKTDVYLDDAFGTYLSEYVYYELMEEFLKMNGQKMPSEKNTSKNAAKAAGLIKNLMADIVVSEPDQVDRIISSDYVLSRLLQ